jgi:hypothetical protein
MRFNIHRLWKAKFLTIHRFARFIWVNHHFADVEIFPVFLAKLHPSAAFSFPSVYVTLWLQNIDCRAICQTVLIQRMRAAR